MYGEMAEMMQATGMTRLMSTGSPSVLLLGVNKYKISDILQRVIKHMMLLSPAPYLIGSILMPASSPVSSQLTAPPSMPGKNLASVRTSELAC